MLDSLTPWTVAFQVPLSMGFPRQEYWNGLPFPSPGDFPDPGIDPTPPAWQVDFLTLSHLGTLKAEEIKKRCQEYTETYVKNVLVTQITMMVWSFTWSETS